MIGGLIMVHSDDNGLVLPPKIAPRQVVIVPIGSDKDIIELCDDYCKKLNERGVTTFIDKSDRTPGFKFAEHEVNGIPVRIELGMRDYQNGQVTLSRRDTRGKAQVGIGCDIVKVVKELLDEIQSSLYTTALKRQKEKTYICTNLEEVDRIMNSKPGFVKAMWCGDSKCEEKIKEIRGMKARCILEDEKPVSNKCIACGKPAKHLVVWGIQY